jgi:broad specificity phosphatase PhoE
MLTLFYSPHMTSIDNEAGRASGHADVPLSERGQQLALELGQHYATKKPDAVFCSDLQRASRTGQIAFSRRSVPRFTDARLRETDFGDLTQHPPTELDEEQHIREPYPNGESLLMAVERVGSFLHDIMREYDDQTIVVIGHKATKWGIEYYCGDATLEEVIHTPWEWRDVPIWQYTLDKHHLERRLLTR